jgi:hypothetical protein
LPELLHDPGVSGVVGDRIESGEYSDHVPVHDRSRGVVSDRSDRACGVPSDPRKRDQLIDPMRDLPVEL